jgi:PTS system ascorbate-specific IIA component
VGDTSLERVRSRSPDPGVSRARAARSVAPTGSEARVIGLVIVAHAPLASALAAGAAHVYTCAPDFAEAQLRAYDVPADSDVATAVTRARALVAAVDAGSGVLVLTDVLGATPGNVASQLAEPGRVAVVAGVNLPMLLRALCYREGCLADTVDKALAGGAQGVVQVTTTPPQNQSQRGASPLDPARIHDQQ